MGMTGILRPAELWSGFSDWIVVDARPQSDYRTGHVPGAIQMDWEAWCEPPPNKAPDVLAEPGYWGVLASVPPEAVRERLESAGLWSGRPIVVYADGPRSKGRDGRIAWMLLYLGATTVFLLDGGWPAWVALGGAVETDSVPHARGTFEVAYQSRRRRSLRDLQAELTREPSPVLVDTRFASEVTRERHPYLAREGVLPRALHLPFDALFDPDGRFVDEVQYRYTAPATLLQAREVVAYCEVGVRACTFALLHETYTGEVVAVFDGSHNQWSLDSNPLRRPEAVRACYSSPALAWDGRDESAEERSSSDAP